MIDIDSSNVTKKIREFVRSISSTCLYSEINGTNVHVCGVAHYPTNHNKGLDNILNKLSGNDVILIEGFANIDVSLFNLKEAVEDFIGSDFYKKFTKNNVDDMPFLGAIDPLVGYSALTTTLLDLTKLNVTLKAFAYLLSRGFDLNPEEIQEITVFRYLLFGIYGFTALYQTLTRNKTVIGDLAYSVIKPLLPIYSKIIRISLDYIRRVPPETKNVNLHREVGMAYAVKRVIEEVKPDNVLVVVGMAHRDNIYRLLSENWNDIKDLYNKYKNLYQRSRVVLYKGRYPIKTVELENYVWPNFRTL